MASNKLDNLLRDKSFLKQGDLLDATSGVVNTLMDYKVPLIFLAILVLLILVGVPIYQHQRDSRAEEFSQKMYDTEKGLKKEADYNEVLSKYGTLPAVKLANLKLADYYVSNQDPGKALGILDQGLVGAKADVFGTLLVLKKMDILKSQNKLKEAYDFAVASGDKVLPTFKDKLRMLEAELLISTGNVTQAKTIYENLVNSKAALEPGNNGEQSDFDPEVTNQAKEKLMLINLGKL